MLLFWVSPYLPFPSPATPQLSSHFWRHTGLCSVSQVRWVHLEASMKQVRCLLRLESLWCWKEVAWELGGENEKTKWTQNNFNMGMFIFVHEEINRWIRCFCIFTFREGALIDHRAPGAGQLVKMEANSKFVLGIGLQISHEESLFTPAEYMHTLRIVISFTDSILTGKTFQPTSDSYV